MEVSSDYQSGGSVSDVSVGCLLSTTSRRTAVPLGLGHCEAHTPVAIIA